MNFENIKKYFKAFRNKICASIFFLVVLIFYFACVLTLVVYSQSHLNQDYNIVFVYGMGTVFVIAELWIFASDKHTHLERRIIYSSWLFALTFNVISILNLKSSYSLGEVLYKAILLFMGEWSIEGIELGPLEFGRFFALLVTSGSVLVVVLRQKIMYRKIRKRYKDVVIISDKPEGYVMDLANSLMSQYKSSKVVVGFTGAYDHQGISGDIPIIAVNVEENRSLKLGLEACNVKKANTIYLLNSETEINVQIAKEIYEKDHKKKSQEIIKSVKKEIDKILRKYEQEDHRREDDKSRIAEIENVIRNVWSQGTGAGKICYIQYRTDEERNFYSFDEAFNHINKDFNTCFINPYDISIRQMISCSEIGKSYTENDINEVWQEMHQNVTKEDAFIKCLEGINILVAGSRQLLRRTIFEISRISIYNNQLPYTIYYLDYNISGMDETEIDKLLQLNISSEHFIVEKMKPEDVKSLKNIKQFFISSTSETEIRRLLEVSFQHGIGNIAEEIFITTKGSDSEYEILNNYLNAIFTPNIIGNDIKHTVYISRVTDLLMRFKDFDRIFGKTADEVFLNYILNTTIDEDNVISVKRFDMLPEFFKDSTLLSVMHNEYLLNLIESLSSSVDLSLDSHFDEMSKAIKYLCETEHNRWFNERSLQGFIYDIEKNNLINKNPSLLKWKFLSSKLKKGHIDFVIPSLKKGLADRSDRTISNNLIRTITIEKANEEEHHEISTQAN